MMKQPAENPNATPLDEKLAAERRIPLTDPAVEFQEIEVEAKRLATARGSDATTPEDWNQATAIVRNRNKALSKA